MRNAQQRSAGRLRPIFLPLLLLLSLVLAACQDTPDPLPTPQATFPVPAPTLVPTLPAPTPGPTATAAPELPAWALFFYSVQDPWQQRQPVQPVSDDPQRVIVAGAGESADLPAWLQQTLPAHPAHRRLLLISGPAIGRGYAPDRLPIADLAAALDAALAGEKLDLIGLDAPLSADYTWLSALQPFARTALVQPGSDLPPSSLLWEAISAAPDQAALQPGWLAVDLHRFPSATAALEQMVARFHEDPAVNSAAFAAAAALAPRTPPILSPDLRAPLVDLNGWATALAQDNPAWAVPAQQLLRALAAVTSPSDPAIPALLIEAGALPTASSGVVAPPTLTLIAAPQAGMAINPAQPGWSGYEWRGREVTGLEWLLAREEPDGRLLLLATGALPSPHGMGAPWPDGIHSGFQLAPDRAAVLRDSTQSDWVLRWPVSERLEAVRGLYWREGAAEGVPAALLFSAASAADPHRLAALLIADDGIARPVAPYPGDRFQLWRHFLADNGELLPENAATLELATLALEIHSLPDRDYRLGYRLTAADGTRQTALAPITRAATAEAESWHAWLDPWLGFQFRYPADWLAPAYDEVAADGILTAGSPDGRVQLAVQMVPGYLADGELSADWLRQQVLAGWEGVSLLYEDATLVAGELAARTAYGYLADSGRRTGLLATFQHNGAGFVVDLDFPYEEEAVWIATFNRMLESWQFRPIGLGFSAESWAALAHDAQESAPPSGFSRELLQGGWQRYRATTAPRTFFALRTDPLSGLSAADLSAAWVRVLADGTADLVIDPPAGIPFAGLAWIATPFRYTAGDGTPINGVLMTSLRDGERVFWAEAPADQWDTFREYALILGAAEWR